MKRLPVHETFHSFQGEGCHMGRSAFFIRLFGCPVHCPWCDSAGTWHPDHIPEKINKLSAEELANMAATGKPDFVVITGGEPAIHDLTELTLELHQRGIPCHLETSGAFPIRGTLDWITLSPKRWKEPLTENITKANEFKVIVDRPEEIQHWENTYGLSRLGNPVWLHPEWSLAKDKETLEHIASHVSENGFPFRAGWQIHKEYHVR